MKMIYSKEEKENLTQEELEKIFIFVVDSEGTNSRYFFSDIKILNNNDNEDSFSIIMNDDKEILLDEESFLNVKKRKLRFEIFGATGDKDIDIKVLFADMFKSKMIQEINEISKQHYSDLFKQKEADFIEKMDKLEEITEKVDSNINDVYKIIDQNLKDIKKSIENINSNTDNYKKSIEKMNKINIEDINKSIDIMKETSEFFQIAIEE